MKLVGSMTSPFVRKIRVQLQEKEIPYEFVLENEVPRKIGQGNLHQDNSDINGRVSRVVSRGKTAPIRAFLMKIRKEWYQEDQLAKEEVNKQVDEALRQGTPGGNVVENQYVPKGHRQQI